MIIVMIKKANTVSDFYWMQNAHPFAHSILEKPVTR